MVLAAFKKPVAVLKCGSQTCPLRHRRFRISHDVHEARVDVSLEEAGVELEVISA